MDQRLDATRAAQDVSYSLGRTAQEVGWASGQGLANLAFNPSQVIDSILSTAQLAIMWKYLEAWGQLMSVFVGLLYLGKLIWFFLKCCFPCLRPWNFRGHFQGPTNPPRDPGNEEEDPRPRLTTQE